MGEDRNCFWKCLW